MIPPLQDTIVALATPPGEGAIAVLRLSGSRAFEVAAKVFSGPVNSYASHTVHCGKILDERGAVLDTVLLLIMRAPRSYTGEHSIEISCHGGSLVVRRILELLCRAGARPAQPGEFSLRAFLNGKIDLAQAEAVQQLIAAKGELALSAAGRQLEGALSQAIFRFHKELTDIAAILEAWVDFPEEGLEFASPGEMCASLEDVCLEMERLQATFHEGKVLSEGLSLCLVGAPNVGKSSLMNALLGKERAIVTAIAGTTRDLLEEDIRLCGLPFRLIDTAGIRNTEEIIEKEGICRSKKAMEEADLILLLLDASRPLAFEDRELLAHVPREKAILVWNKIDLAEPSEKIEWAHSVALSAKKRLGLDALSSAIEKWVWKRGAPSKEEVVITQLRHFQSLSNAIASCRTVIAGLKKEVSPEFAASDLRAALNELGAIIGANVTEELLSAIFSRFCVGK